MIDNYDSFVHNLARYFMQLGQSTRVVRNDALSLDDVRRLHPGAIVLSPGPCTPAEAGISVELVQQLHPAIPILGVCLGHQAIAAAFGGQVIRGTPMHGRTSQIFHDGRGGFPKRYPNWKAHEEESKINGSALVQDHRVWLR